MTPEEIKEGNKLIAEFVGHHQINHTSFGLCYPIGSGLYYPEDMLYHSSWDWLMEVIKRINTLDNPLKDSDTTLSTMKHDLQIYTGRVYIEKAFTTAIRIIKWYNKQQKK